MSLNATGLNERLREYILDQSLREASILQAIREEQSHHKDARIQIAEEQGQFIQFFVKSMKASLAMELGVLFGYSAICIAKGLADGGQLIACEKNPANAEIAKSYFERAELTETIELKVCPALELMNAELETERKGKYDFIFIDADKKGYLQYYELALELLRVGGVVAIDNVLWYERILDDLDNSPITSIIRTFNEHIKNDQRIDVSMLPIGDGLTLARKL